MFSVEDYWQIFAHHLNMAIEAYVPLKKKPTHIDSKKKTYPKRIKKRCLTVKLIIGGDGLFC